MKELLLVGVGRMGRPYLEAARRLDLRVRAAEAVTRVDAVRDDLDSVEIVWGDSDEHWVAAAQAAARQHPPDGVIAFSEPQVMAAALVQEARRLPGPSLHAAVLSRNKALQRGVFASLGIQQPDHRISTDLTEEVNWVADRLPVVVKPLSGSGSDGVQQVDTLAAYLDLAARHDQSGTLLVETAVTGPEYSWEALVLEGCVWFANITQKETTGPPHFVEISHRTGVQLPSHEMEQVHQFAVRVLAGLRMCTGVVHLEFRVTTSGPSLMEVAVRTPGDFILDLLSLTYGVDWFEMIVRASMAMPLPAPPTGPVRFAASYLPSASAGVVRQIDGWTEVAGHPCVVNSALLVTEGDTVAPLRSSSMRIGHVVLAADTREQVNRALEDVRTKLTLQTAGENTAGLV